MGLLFTSNKCASKLKLQNPDIGHSFVDSMT